ncbi:MAG TPA: glycoside hydrolase family 3 N-terminal domain-containing protein [Saprospiraceae bacterium]|nr:glycoside hydrolase family 3 N-terminal domain-containing protein [Saprospiraceae bacterium]
MRRFGYYLLCILFLTSGRAAWSQDTTVTYWVDSVFSSMSLEDKIGQLFIIRAHSDLGDDHVQSVLSQIKKYHVGGLCFFQGTPKKQAELTVKYQEASSIPLLVSMDAEWGLGMRFKDKGLSFPRQLMLGAVQDYSQIEAMGYAIGMQLKAVGVNVSYSPVADINNNPLNPVIGDRSFGEDRDDVAQRAIAYMKGLKAAGVMACGKHFPGHGDTDMDSHFDLPALPFDKTRLKEKELYPFQELINAGIPSVMVAHLHVPAIDSAKNISTTLSAKAINDLLKNEMGFNGLVITDGLEMKGVTKNFSADEVAVMAIAAGNDLLLLPDNMDLAFKGLKKAFTDGTLSIEQLNNSVWKILVAKYELGLHQMVLPDPVNAEKMAFDPNAVGIKYQLIEDAITVVQNKSAFIPIVNVMKPKMAAIAIGSTQPTRFQDRLDSYMQIDHYNVSHSLKETDITSLLKNLQAYDKVIISIHNLNNKVASNFGLTKDELALIQNINRLKDVILVVFGSPYSLKYFENIDHILMAYEDSPEVEDITAQGLMGVYGFSGKLPVTASNIFPLHQGFTTPSLKRMGYSVPERVGMSSDSLETIKYIVDRMVKNHAAPGCEILIAKDGRIVYQESFGYQTYDMKEPVYQNDLYDIASITKVAATTPTVMRLYKEGVIDIHKTLGDYLPWLKGSNKEHMVIERVMAHQAGLQSWIPFYEKTVRAYDDGSYEQEPDIYCDMPSLQYCVPVAEDMYLDNDYINQIHHQIYISPLNADGTYVYSDLGFIMLAEIIRNETGVSIDHYVDSVFYQPLGLRRIGYRPLQRFATGEIVPSEIDTYFRCQELRGYVHDMGCAMMGGVSGHAGVFTDAEDLAVFFQMYMNGGSYGGRDYIDPDILKLFTTRYQNSTRRGVGFDMRELEPGKHILVARDASASTYGHTGFTGACVWNDPVHQLVYVFLSNRTYPTMRNDALKTMDIREKIHQRAYKAMAGYHGYTIEPPQG